MTVYDIYITNRDTRFRSALDYVAQNEGVFSNDPNDPGGATKYGISLQLSS